MFTDSVWLREQFQATEVREKMFSQRIKASHDLLVHHVQESDTLSSHFGVKPGCVRQESLNYFIQSQVLPPDILHDLREGIDPVELSLCIK